MADNINHLDKYQPSTKDSDAVRKVTNMFGMARKARGSVEKLWREAEGLYQGNHWESMNMPKFKNQITVDLIASAIDTMIPILSSRPPKIDIIAVAGDERGSDVAGTVQAFMDELWTIRDMQNLIPEFLLDYLVYGTGVMKVNWNNVDDLPDCDVVDPFNFYVNPSATKLENAEWVCIVSPMPIYEIKERFENGKYVKPMSDLDKFSATKIGTTDVDGEKVQVTDTKGQETNYYESMGKAMEDLEPRALVIECYMRDPSKEYVVDDEGKEVHKRKYPNGMRQVIVSNGVLLYDGQTKYPFFNRENHLPHPFPFVSIKNTGSPHSFWGKPEPKRLKSLNLAMDRISSQVMDNIHLTANPMWVIDESTGVENQITNKPAQVIRKKGAGSVEMKSPPSMPGYVFNFYELLSDVFETVSGVNKSTQGKDSSNVTSGVQAQIYRQASTTKIDFKSRSVDQAISTLGAMWVAMFKHLGSSIVRVNYINEDGLSEQRDMVGVMFRDVDMLVRAKAGSMLPENRMFIENKILQLAQLGIVTDPEYIVDSMELPGKERLLAKIREEKAKAEAEENAPVTPDQLGGNEDEIYETLMENPELADKVQT
ncbi:MAG TPA: hypothetical protein EYF95_08085 [Flavobacteriales bacterium]|nr:hypothetical protein [Flavobacteriales bacterium]HIK67915.1 hypothetical protein [Flavobacteriales bacterium]